MSIDTLPAEARSVAPKEYRLEFTGSGSEYFRIWIVNLALTLVTVGIYSAWAKVRRMQYFHRNTRLDGASFDFHADPKAILKGRIFSLIFFAALVLILAGTPPVAGLTLVFVILAGAGPKLLRQSMRFRAHNTSYRGLRFEFIGTQRAAHWVAVSGAGLFVSMLLISELQEAKRVGWAAVLGLALYFISFPLFHTQLKRYQLAKLTFGHSRFQFSAGFKDYLMIYLESLVLYFLPAIGAIGALMAGSTAAAQRGESTQPADMLPAVFILYLGIGAVCLFAKSRFQNVLWKNLQLEGVRFDSQLRTRDLLKAWAINLPLLAISLGLYWPFAMARVYQMQAAAVAVNAPEGLEGFAAQATTPETQALASEAADAFDVGLSI